MNKRRNCLPPIRGENQFLSREETVKKVKEINFGDLDGAYEKNLQSFFLDQNYWETLIEGDIFYVIGRKGTGKSTLYKWIKHESSSKGAMVANLSFNDFPFEKFLALTDNTPMKPNQYKSIWKNVILIELAKLIVTDQNAIPNENFLNINGLLKFLFGDELTDLYKQTAQKVFKNTTGLSFNNDYLAGNFSNESQITSDFSKFSSNITEINTFLENTIHNYLIEYSGTPFIIQFDQLDENYNKYNDKEDYFQCIISLFSTIYTFSQEWRSEDIPVKILGYLRSDIFYLIDQHNPDSAKWKQFLYTINWSIVNKNDWENPRLLQLINKRIEVSLGLKNSNDFYYLFNRKYIQIKRGEEQEFVFKYMIHRTFHRPRDLIQFCRELQKQIKKDNNISYVQLVNAEKEYSLWLLSEVENEIGPQISDTSILFEFLRELGERDYSISDFKEKYNRFQDSLNMSPDNLLELLYQLGVIMNVDSNPRRQNEMYFYSIIRNDRSKFNRDLRIMTHNGFYKGLHTSKLYR